MIPLLIRLRRPGAAAYNLAWSRRGTSLAGDDDKTLMKSAAPRRTSATGVDMGNLLGGAPVVGAGMLRGISERQG